MITGLLYAMEREGGVYRVAEYAPSGNGYSPVWREVLADEFYVIAEDHTSYRSHYEVAGGYVLQFYDLDSQLAELAAIERDLELTQYYASYRS